MELSRKYSTIIVANLMTYIRFKNWAPLSTWSTEQCKAVFGLGKTFFYNNGKGLFETYDNGKRIVMDESIDLLCKATGIRFYDLKGKLINMGRYHFDKQAANDFRAHIRRKYGQV